MEPFGGGAGASLVRHHANATTKGYDIFDQNLSSSILYDNAQNYGAHNRTDHDIYSDRTATMATTPALTTVQVVVSEVYAKKCELPWHM